MSTVNVTTTSNNAYVKSEGKVWNVPILATRVVELDVEKFPVRASDPKSKLLLVELIALFVLSSSSDMLARDPLKDPCQLLSR